VAKTLGHAFVSSRFDYYNSLPYVSDSPLKKLQTVQNLGVWVITGARKHNT